MTQYFQLRALRILGGYANEFYATFTISSIIVGKKNSAAIIGLLFCGNVK
jgi:hypothetical protein